jgi:hypothetical protein
MELRPTMALTLAAGWCDFEAYSEQTMHLVIILQVVGMHRCAHRLAYEDEVSAIMCSEITRAEEVLGVAEYPHGVIGDREDPAHDSRIFRMALRVLHRTSLIRRERIPSTLCIILICP